MAYQIAPKICFELVGFEYENQNYNEQKQRQNFKYGGDCIDKACLLNASQNNKVKKPNQNGTADDGIEIVSALEIWRR